MVCSRLCRGVSLAIAFDRRGGCAPPEYRAGVQGCYGEDRSIAGVRRDRVQLLGGAGTMASTAAFAEVAAMAGDPARAAMLHALMDGRALTASELARVAGIAPQTASGHLARMTETGLLAVAKQGRHRYHRLGWSGVGPSTGVDMRGAAAPAPAHE